MTGARDPATLDAVMADQLGCMLPLELGPARPGAAYVRTLGKPPGPRALRDWFPMMPALDASGGADGLLLGHLGMDVAVAAYINSPTPLDAAGVAALLPDAALAAPHDGVAPGGALVFHGDVTLGDFGPLLVGLTGLPLTTVAMAGLIDFSSGYPYLTLTASLDAPFEGHLAEARLTLGSPLFPAAGDARIRLRGGVPITGGTTPLMLEIEAEVTAGGPIVASIGIENAPGLAEGLAPPGLPAMTATAGGALSLRLGRNRGWFTLDRIAFTAGIADWVLLPGLVTLDRATLAVAVTDPTGERNVTALVSATASFGAAKLTLTGTGAYPAGLFTLALAKPGTLGQILGELGIPASDLDALTVTTCQVAVDRMAGTLSADVAVAGEWKLGPFELTALSFQARHPTAASLAGQFVLGGVAFAATADYRDGAWALTAAAVIGPAGLTLTPLLQALGLPAPGFVNEIVLDACSVARDASGGVSLSLRGGLAIGPGLGLSLDVVPKQVSGKLTVGDDLVLDLIVDPNSGTVTATLGGASKAAGPDLRLGDIARRFGLDIPGLDEATLRGCAMSLTYVES